MPYIVHYRKVSLRLDGLIDQTKSIPSSQESAIYGSPRRKSNPTKKTTGLSESILDD